MKIVWIVDDDEEMGHAISLMLQLLECETRYFSHPRTAAQALLAGGKPDIVLQFRICIERANYCAA